MPWMSIMEFYLVNVYNSIKSIPPFKLCDIAHEEEKPKRCVQR
jgi:hypothetical protein